MEDKDYGEIFCQAVDEIVGQRLESVKYDSTILCTIVDDSYRDTGKYVVTHNGGITKFEAYSDNTTYRNNNNVYVQIPGGDWDQQKIIIAKKTDNDDEPYIYKKPFSSLVDITGNLITSNIETKATGLVANDGYTNDGYTGEKVIRLWNYNYNDNQVPLCNEEGQTQSAYTRLGIQAGFQSWLNNFYTSTGNDEVDSVQRAVIEGKYGLRLTIIPKREQVISVESKDTETAQYILELNTDDMNGNPYNFDSFYTQQKLFDISSIGDIESMYLDFYEQSGTFKDSEGYYIPDVDFLNNAVMPNLYVNDIYITLGYDVDEFDTEIVSLYTLDATTYSRTADPATDNHKKLQIRWIHKLDDGSYKSITSADDIGEYEVRWYRYKLGSASADEYSGVYWKALSNQITDGIGYANSQYNIQDEDWINYNLTCDDGYYRQAGFFTSWAIPDTTLAEESYKVIILRNGVPYRSNTLTFLNKDEVVSAPTVDAVQALNINCEDNTYGNYRIYNQGNSLIDASQSAVQRTWKLYFNSALNANNSETASVLTEAEQIEWIIPVEKTMIVMDGLPDKDNIPTDQLDYYSYDDQGNVHIFKYGVKSDKYKVSNKNTLNYRIKGYYSQSYSNNTIQCKIIKDKITYTATKEMTFGVAGTTGTDCTFILDFDNGVTAVCPEIKKVLLDENDEPLLDEDGNKIKQIITTSVTARLYDYENNEIDLENYFSEHDEAKISWSWKKVESEENDEYNYGYINIENVTGITTKLTYNTDNKDNKGKDFDVSYNILQAKLEGWGDYDLIAYLPIPLRKTLYYDYIQGTTQIIYNSNGELVDYFKNPYALYENGKIKTDIYWDIQCSSQKEKDNGFIPELKKSKNDEYYLSPLSFYVKDSCERVCVIARDSSGNALWTQPLLIMTNRYPSAMLNNWDGSLDVGKTDTGTILAPRLAAGKKDPEDNTFSGLILGDWEGINSADEITTQTGIYGYDKGEQTYAFKQDGTAFIGKSGVGRIKFNGTSGIIESAGYDGGKGQGMQIDLTNNLIDAKKFNTNSVGDQLASNVSVFKLSDGDPFLIITNPQQDSKGNNKILMNVGGSSYYLQSANYENSLLTTTSTTYAVLGAAYNTHTYNRWKSLYTTLYYKSNESYYTSSFYTQGQTLYRKITKVDSQATRTGSYFDLNNGELIINRGYINGDVILQPDEGIKYTTYKSTSSSYSYGDSNYGGTQSNTYHYVTTDSSETVPQSSLVNILAELYSNLSRTQAGVTAADGNAKSAKSIATYAATIAQTAYTASSNATKAINDLSYYFSLGYGDKEQRTITMASHEGGYITVGNNVSIYSDASYGCQVHCDLHIESDYNIYIGGTNLQDYVYNIASSLVSSSS